MASREPTRTRVAATPVAARRRGAALEAAILDAAWNVLVDSGCHGFTYDAVATRAATSRPVLYRRWPTRDELLLATLDAAWTAHPIKVPDTGRLRNDALGLLRHANAGRARSTTLVAAQLMDWFRQTGRSFATLRAGLAAGKESAFEIIVRRAVERGELRSAPASRRVVNLPFDLLRYELFTTLRAVPSDTLAQIVDEVWLPLLRAGAGNAA